MVEVFVRFFGHDEEDGQVLEAAPDLAQYRGAAGFAAAGALSRRQVPGHDGGGQSRFGAQDRAGVTPAAGSAHAQAVAFERGADAVQLFGAGTVCEEVLAQREQHRAVGHARPPLLLDSGSPGSSGFPGFWIIRLSGCLPAPCPSVSVPGRGGGAGGAGGKPLVGGWRGVPGGVCAGRGGGAGARGAGWAPGRVGGFRERRVALQAAVGGPGWPYLHTGCGGWRFVTGCRGDAGAGTPRGRRLPWWGAVALFWRGWSV
ncbi:hypothetical protein GCM10020000_84830 [Streptomyces olivoverticillatus]